MPKEKNWDWKEDVWYELECNALLNEDEKEMLKDVFSLASKEEVCGYIIERLQRGDEKVCRVLEKLTNKLICRRK